MTFDHANAVGSLRLAGSPERDLSHRLFWPALALWALAKAWLSWGRYVNQDEFESLHQAWLMFSGALPYRDFNSNHPPLAFELLSWLNHLTDDSVALILLARGITFLSSAVVLYLLFRISRDIDGERAARWTVLAYAANATFLEWSTEVRTEFLLVPLWLAAVCLLFSPRPRLPALRMVLIGLLMGTAFWVNQKVIFHAAPIGVFMLLGGPQRTWRLRHVALALTASAVPAFLVLGRAWLDGSLPYMMEHNFSGAWGLVTKDYYGAWRWLTLRLAFQRDMGFVLLAVAASIRGVVRRNTAAHHFIILAALWMLVTLWLTPGPFPYYLLSVFPLFAVAIGALLADVQEQLVAGIGQRPALGYPAFAAAIIFFAAFPLIRLTKFVRPTNDYQFTVLRLAHDVAPPGTRVFDGAGTMLNRPDAYPFHWVLWQPEMAAYHEGKLPPLLPTLRRHGCRLVIDTYRLRRLKPEDLVELQRHFVHFWGPLSVSGYDTLEEIDTQPRPIELWYDGLYEANRADVLVDGRPAGEPLALSAGHHTVALRTGRGRVTLREVSRIRAARLPADRGDPSLFLGTYGYGY